MAGLWALGRSWMLAYSRPDKLALLGLTGSWPGAHSIEDAWRLSRVGPVDLRHAAVVAQMVRAHGQRPP